MHVDLRIDGVTIVDGELDLHSLIIRLQEAEEYGLWLCTPLTFEQAQDLVSRLSPEMLELVRQVVLRGGSITWPNVMKICRIGIGGFHEFLFQWHLPLKQLVGTVTGRNTGELVTWIPDALEWDSDGCKDVKFYIDGPALTSLRQVLLG